MWCTAIAIIIYYLWMDFFAHAKKLDYLILLHQIERCTEAAWVLGNKQDVDSEVLALKKAMNANIDVTIDCVGFNKSMNTALRATRSGGRICLVGMGHNEMTVPLTPAAAR